MNYRDNNFCFGDMMVLTYPASCGIIYVRGDKMKFDENIYVNLTNLNPRANITQFARVIPNRSYAFSRRLGRYLFDYVVSGQGYVVRDGKRIRVGAGDLIYMKKGAVIEYGADAEEPYAKLWVSVDGSVADALAKAYLSDETIVIRHNVPEDIFLTLRSIFATTGFDERRVTHFICDLFMTLADISAPVRISDDKRELSERFREYIDRRITERFTLDEAAEVFHVSKRHLIRVFKEKYETTPGAYHAESKFSAACRYLAETTYTVGEISAMLGFCDQSFFSTAFRRRFGVSPVEFRKNER